MSIGSNDFINITNVYFSLFFLWVWYLLVRFEGFGSFFCFRGKNAGILFAFLYAYKNAYLDTIGVLILLL